MDKVTHICENAEFVSVRTTPLGVATERVDFEGEVYAYCITKSNSLFTQSVAYLCPVLCAKGLMDQIKGAVFYMSELSREYFEAEFKTLEECVSAAIFLREYYATTEA